VNRISVTVALRGLSDSEKIIFKLILSVSQRSAARNYCYYLCDEQQNADVCISTDPKDLDGSTILPPPLGILLLADKSINNSEVISIKRPLIASRVLSTLDQHCKERQRKDGNNNVSMVNSEASEHTKLSNEHESGKQGKYNGFAKKEIQELDFNFSISEDEASKLAIVHDENLSNPSNKDSFDEVGDSLNKGDMNVSLASVIVADENKIAEVKTTKLPTKKTALVVDDSASVRKQMEIELDLFNVHVDFAEDAERALDLLEKKKYNVAFLDVVLPDKDGYHICKAIKQKAETKSTKVIMLTGKATHADKVRGSLSGCDAYLVKPVGRDIFQNTVRRYLDKLQDVERMNV